MNMLINFPLFNVNLIEDGQYGIGLEIRLPNITSPDGTTINKGVLPSKAFIFDLRGIVYDTKYSNKP